MERCEARKRRGGGQGSKEGGKGEGMGYHGRKRSGQREGSEGRMWKGVRLGKGEEMRGEQGGGGNGKE